ncbi:MAG: hypothetical protein NTY10_03180 [Candidatus Omnitrophica bacterium]|nr:hypothetical protein [Candidatus Omnitrophota bacterium]
MKPARCFVLFLCLSASFFLPQIVPAQNAGALQYQFQPDQALRYRLDLQHEVKMSGGGGQGPPVATKITFQASVRMVEADSAGVVTCEARAENFSARTIIGAKESVLPASATGQTVRFRLGSCGLLPGQETLVGSPGLPWNLFLSQVFPDLTRCRYLGPAVFNGKPCSKIGFDLAALSSARTEKGNTAQARDNNQGKGTGLFADGHLVSGETQGGVDLACNLSSPERSAGSGGVSAKGVFSSRLFLLP